MTQQSHSWASWLILKTLMLGMIEGRRRRGWQRLQWLYGIIDSLVKSLSKLRVMVKYREAWHAVVHWVTVSWTGVCYWITTATTHQEAKWHTRGAIAVPRLTIKYQKVGGGQMPEYLHTLPQNSWKKNSLPYQPMKLTNPSEPACQCRRHKRRGFDPCVWKTTRRRKWQPTSVFLPAESHGQRSLWATGACSPVGCKEPSNTWSNYACIQV